MAMTAHEMERSHYDRVSRYASGAFKRMQLQQLLSVAAPPPFFETAGEAQAYLRQG